MPDASNKEVDDDTSKDEPKRRFFFADSSPLYTLFGIGGTNDYYDKKERCQFMSYQQTHQQGFFAG